MDRTTDGTVDETIDRTTDRATDKPSDKSPGAFRTISEVAEDLDLPQHVLRFWETRFGSIRPLKRGGGRRYYRPDDVDLLKGIRHLLYGRGYTIKGVQRIIKEEGPRFVQAIGRGEQGAVASVRHVAEGGNRGETPDEYPDEFPNGNPGEQRVSGPAETARILSVDADAQVELVACSMSAGSPEGSEMPVTGGDLPSATGDALGSKALGVQARDLDRLRAVLDDLRECQRMLGALLAE